MVFIFVLLNFFRLDFVTCFASTTENSWPVSLRLLLPPCSLSRSLGLQLHVHDTFLHSLCGGSPGVVCRLPFSKELAIHEKGLHSAAPLTQHRQGPPHILYQLCSPLEVKCMIPLMGSRCSGAPYWVLQNFVRFAGPWLCLVRSILLSPFLSLDSDMHRGTTQLSFPLIFHGYHPQKITYALNFISVPAF